MIVEYNGARGIGRTTRAMLDAPENAIYVWCNDSTWYAKTLARYLGRDDLYIVGPNGLNFLSERRCELIVDHAAKLTDSQARRVSEWRR